MHSDCAEADSAWLDRVARVMPLWRVPRCARPSCWGFFRHAVAVIVCRYVMGHMFQTPPGEGRNHGQGG